MSEAAAKATEGKGLAKPMLIWIISALVVGGLIGHFVPPLLKGKNKKTEVEKTAQAKK